MVNYDHLPAASRYFDGKLYQNMNDDLQLAGMSNRTVHGYLHLTDTAEANARETIEQIFRRR